MKNKILAFSMAILVCSFSEAQAVGTSDVDGRVDAFAGLDWSFWTVTGAVEYERDFYYNLSNARTASVWDITTQPLATPVVKYYEDSTFKESVMQVDGNEAAKATGETGNSPTHFIDSESTVMLMPGSYGSYSAEANAWRGQSYEVTAPGTVTFSIPYVVDVVYNDTDDNNNEYGVAMAWIHLRKFDGGANLWSDTILTENFFTQEGVGNAADTLLLSYTFSSLDPDGTFILLEAGGDTRAAIMNPVPVPPSVLMLLTGCTSLFFMKRRKS